MDIKSRQVLCQPHRLKRKSEVSTTPYLLSIQTSTTKNISVYDCLL